MERSDGRPGLKMFIRKRNIAERLAQEQRNLQGQANGGGPQKTFTLDEAARMIPEVSDGLAAMRQEVAARRDDLVLYKRLFEAKGRRSAIVSAARGEVTDALTPTADEKLARRNQRRGFGEHESRLLEHKWQALEACMQKWNAFFAERGVVIRDMERGLVDFPYRTKDGELLCLCWEEGEDGVFYFHTPEAGYAGRKPVSLLPD